MTDAVIGQVRSAMAASLEQLDLAAYTYNPTSPPTTNAAYIKPEPFGYHQDFDDGADLRFSVRLIIPSANEQAAQDLLDAWISPEGPQSAIAALESDASLGGVVSSTAVFNLNNYGPLQFTDGRYCQAAELLVSVFL